MPESPDEEETEQLLAQFCVFATTADEFYAFFQKSEELDILFADADQSSTAVADAQAFLERVTGCAKQ